MACVGVAARVGSQPRDDVVQPIWEALFRSTQPESALRMNIQPVRGWPVGARRRAPPARNKSKGDSGDTRIPLKFDAVASCFRSGRNLVPYHSVGVLFDRRPPPTKFESHSPADIFSKRRPRATRLLKGSGAPEQSVVKKNSPLEFDLDSSHVCVEQKHTKLSQRMEMHKIEK